MAAGRDLTTEAEIDAALDRAKIEPSLPEATDAYYNRELEVVVIKLDNGQRLVIPREHLQGLASATEEQLAEIEIFNGSDVAWPQLDVDHFLPFLIEGRYGSIEWMKSLKSALVAA